LMCLEDMAFSSSYFIDKSEKPERWRLEWVSTQIISEADFVKRLTILAGSNDNVAQPLRIEDVSFDIEKLPNLNWLEESYRALPPIDIGDFFVYGSHFGGDLPQHKICLLIEAATAFGSGEHGTTAGCLQAIQDLKNSGVNPSAILDMGTGSGILAIAAHALWGKQVVAVDIDEEAIIVTQLHIDANNLPQDQFICATGCDVTLSEIKDNAPFDVVLANILAEPLRKMAQDLSSVVAENGYIVLSGTLKEQAQSVMESYFPHGFVLSERYDIGEWSTLLLQKNTPAQA